MLTPKDLNLSDATTTKTYTSAPAGTKNLAYAASNFRYPYTPQTTLAIERRLGDDTSLAIR